MSPFKTDINAKGEAVFVADSVKSNPLAELFADEGNLDSDSLKALRLLYLSLTETHCSRYHPPNLSY
jgi:hypothetical protein